MNEREKAFCRELSDLGLTKNQSKILLGMMGGRSIRECGLPEASFDRTLAELHGQLKLVEKVDGVWRLSAEKFGLLSGSKSQEKSAATPTPTKTQQEIAPEPAPALQADSSAKQAPQPQVSPPPAKEKPAEVDARLAGLPVLARDFLSRPPAQLPRIWETMKAVNVNREKRLAVAKIKMDYDSGEAIQATPEELAALGQAEGFARRIFGK